MIRAGASANLRTVPYARDSVSSASMMSAGVRKCPRTGVLGWLLSHEPVTSRMQIALVFRGFCTFRWDRRAAPKSSASANSATLAQQRDRAIFTGFIFPRHAHASMQTHIHFPAKNRILCIAVSASAHDVVKCWHGETAGGKARQNERRLRCPSTPKLGKTPCIPALASHLALT